ncbi:DIMBOA UDP-glucosyltransferase BX9-like [Panicum miliaceum]|uniref:DIMBOA UDP-glucosyltransferase BX9-like n=1 Tax=Panicum miliaceum TaxID=4540 RepID=A0A3L6QHZ2_PANMI|nr:DIMBOA UDP-glucosyltransferase BX9-like [Panicum miliaceum]
MSGHRISNEKDESVFVLLRRTGHLTPMLQLAGTMHAAGVPSADLLPSGSDTDFAGTLLWINDCLREPFRDCLC